MDTMTHVWKCSNWNEFLSLQNQHPQSSFHNLTTIHLVACKSIKYLFSPLMVKLLSSLKNVTIDYCHGMEEVVSTRDNDEETTASASTHTTTTLLPHLDSLYLWNLSSLKHVGGGGTTDFINDQLKYSRDGVLYWSLCQYSREISISECHALSSVIPSHVAGQMIKVKVLKIKNCILMKEVFAVTQISSKSDEGRGDTNTVLAIRIPGNVTTHKLSNLTIMHIDECGSLEHIFTFSTLESLVKLEEIRITRCMEMKVIVREENGEHTTASKVVVFPRLKAIKLAYLPNLEGFFLGMNEFQFPLLDDVITVRCPNLLTLTSSKSTAPRLKYIHSTLGKYSPECCNFYVTTTSPQTPSPSLDSTSSFPAILDQSLSLYDTIEVNIEDNEFIEEVFAFNELLQLTNLEKIHVKRCEKVNTVFEVVASEVSDSESNNESQTVVTFPKLREVDLKDLEGLEYMWKSNRWMRLEFPNLTTLSIHNCYYLEYVFTSCMVGSLMQLRDLHITRCFNVRVIIIEEEKDAGNTEDEESGGKDLDVSLPSLNTLVIKQCPGLKVFTKGRMAAPELKVIETNVGLIDIGEHDINSFIITRQQQVEGHFNWI